MSTPRLDPQTAFAMALDTHELGVEIMRQNLRRRDPAALPATIEDRLRQWLSASDEPIGSDFRRVSWPRTTS